MKWKIFLLIMGCLLLSSCGKYLRDVLTYEDICKYIKISDDTFELHIEAGFIDSETLRKLFLSRAAELTVQSGGKYFVVLRDNRVRDLDGKISEREAKLDDHMLEMLKVPQSTYLSPIQLKNQLELSNSGTIKVWNDVPPTWQFYDAALISQKMLPLAKEETRHVGKNRTLPKVTLTLLLLLAYL